MWEDGTHPGTHCGHRAPGQGTSRNSRLASQARRLLLAMGHLSLLSDHSSHISYTHGVAPHRLLTRPAHSGLRRKWRWAGGWVGRVGTHWSRRSAFHGGAGVRVRSTNAQISHLATGTPLQTRHPGSLSELLHSQDPSLWARLPQPTVTSDRSMRGGPPLQPLSRSGAQGQL